MSTSHLTVVPAPRFAGLRTWDCARCGRAEVRPVFLSDGHAYGTGCAAVLLGRPRATRKIRDEADAADREQARRDEMTAERRVRYGQALEDFKQDPNRSTPALDSARRAYHAGGGGTVLGSFPAWIAHVAATGTLEGSS